MNTSNYLYIYTYIIYVQIYASLLWHVAMLGDTKVVSSFPPWKCLVELWESIAAARAGLAEVVQLPVPARQAEVLVTGATLRMMTWISWSMWSKNASGCLTFKSNVCIVSQSWETSSEMVRGVLVQPNTGWA